MAVVSTGAWYQPNPTGSPFCPLSIRHRVGASYPKARWLSFCQRDEPIRRAPEEDPQQLDDRCTSLATGMWKGPSLQGLILVEPGSSLPKQGLLVTEQLSEERDLIEQKWSPSMNNTIKISFNDQQRHTYRWAQQHFLSCEESYFKYKKITQLLIWFLICSHAAET